MPAKSVKQQKYMAIQLAKKRAGTKADVDMTEAQIEDFAATKTAKLPQKVSKKGKKAAP